MRSKRFLSVTVGLLFLTVAACTSDNETHGDKEADVSLKTADEALEADSKAETAEPDAGHGRQVFVTTCATCHGADAGGVEGLGRKLVDNAFVQESSDEKLFELILKGRDPGHPQNQTGIAMPPRGGNPALTDGDIRNVVAYLRTLQES